MGPEEAARELKEELESALEDIAGAAPFTRVVAVEPPHDLGADTAFVVRIRGSADRPAVEHRMPTPLVMGYLADEEAAVDEWRRRVHELSRFGGE